MACWVFSAEGCFFIDVYKSLRAASGFKVALRVKLGLNNRDIAILESIVSYLGCGTLSANSATNSTYISISSLEGRPSKFDYSFVW